MEPVALARRRDGRASSRSSSTSASATSPSDSARRRPHALRARPEVPRPPGGLESSDVFADGDTLPAGQIDGAGRARRRLQHLRRADARGRARTTCVGFGDALRRPRARRSAARSRSCRALLRAPRAGDAQPRRSGHRARRTSSRSSATPLASSRRSPTIQARAVHRRWPTPSRRSAATPSALKAFIEKSPPTLDVSTDSLRVQRPFLSDLADFCRGLPRRDARAARRAADRQRGDRARHRRAAPRRRDSTTRARATLDALDELSLARRRPRAPRCAA